MKKDQGICKDQRGQKQSNGLKQQREAVQNQPQSPVGNRPAVGVISFGRDFAIKVPATGSDNRQTAIRTRGWQCESQAIQSSKLR